MRMDKGREQMRAPFPLRIVIELTSRCNLSCDMCPRHHLDMDSNDMKRDLWERLIREIERESPQSVVLPFWRGESLLHGEFTELMNYALDRNIRIHISTNGQVLGDDHASVLLRCEFVTFSIHTEKGYRNALKLLSMRTGERPTIQISAVEGEETEQIIRSIAAKPDLEGFDSIRLYEEHTKGGVFGRSGHHMEGARSMCPKLQDTLVVAFDGSISRCNHIWLTEDLFVRDMSVREAWNSEGLRSIAATYPDEKCGPCDQWTGHTCGESWRIVGEDVEHRKYGPMGVIQG